MTCYLVAIDAILATSAPSALVGSKAYRLAELRKSGFPVPDGFVVTTDAYKLAHTIGEHGMPPTLVEHIAAAYARLGDNVPVAVRSSSRHEDLQTTSFAGQYETFLNIAGVDALLKQILACWDSTRNDRVVAYRNRHDCGAEPEDASGMAVLVQHFIPADVSGVLFTLNPVTGIERQMVIESSWGLGEGIVSGHVSPDRYTIDCRKQRAVSCYLGEKNQLVRAATQGTEMVAVPENLRHVPSLTQTELHDLATLGERIQTYFGMPQDIEWSFFQGQLFVLQTRPLTGCHFDGEAGQWTRANFRETLPGIASPMSYSLDMQHAFVKTFTAFSRAIRLTTKEVIQTRLFFGRPYWRVDLFKQLMRNFPGFREYTFDNSIGLEPTYIGEGYVTPINLPTLWRGCRVVIHLWRLYITYASQAAKYKRRYLQAVTTQQRANLHTLTDPELAEWIRRILRQHIQTLHVLMFCTFLMTRSNEDLHTAISGLNKRLRGTEEPIAIDRLLTGLHDIRTAGPLELLWEVLRAMNCFPGVAETIKQYPPQQLQQALLAFPAGRDFWHGIWSGYLRRFAYLSTPGEDLASPRWEEDLSFPLALLHTYVQSPINSPHIRAFEQHQVRNQEEQRLRRLLRSHPIRGGYILLLLAVVRRYTWWRENIRELSCMAHYQSRRALLEQGWRWTGGLFERQDDVFWMYEEEILEALANDRNTDEIRARIAHRRLIAQSYRNFEPPQIIGAGSTMPPPPSGSEMLFGVPCSPGVVQGRACVMTSLAQADRLQPADILIASYTNPGWMPLFGLVGAIVIEEGGLLSHGAVVARELGIPTVIRVKDATRLIQTGQQVCVDGARGTVTLLDREPD